MGVKTGTSQGALSAVQVRDDGGFDRVGWGRASSGNGEKCTESGGTQTGFVMDWM